MKKVVLSLLGFGMAFNLWAAALPWLTSVPDAEAQAKKENKLVFLEFTGSDWCVACKQLDADVFAKKAFEDYAKKNLVLVLLDYPLAKQPKELEKTNEDLKDKYKINGYPTLIVLKPDGKVVWKQEGSDITTTAMIAKLDEAKTK